MTRLQRAPAGFIGTTRGKVESWPQSFPFHLGWFVFRLSRWIRQGFKAKYTVGSTSVADLELIKASIHQFPANPLVSSRTDNYLRETLFHWACAKHTYPLFAYSTNISI